MATTQGRGDEHILVARVALGDHPAAQRLVADLGGEVIFETTETA